MEREYLNESKYKFMKHFLKKSKPSKTITVNEKNESVLASQLTKLVGVVMDDNQHALITIDSDALARVWSLESGECIRSYPFETNPESVSSKLKLTALSPDPILKYIVLTFETGIVQVNNLHSGDLIYNEGNQMILDTEVSNLRFFHKNSNYWFIVTCWEGKCAFFSKS